MSESSVIFRLGIPSGIQVGRRVTALMEYLKVLIPECLFVPVTANGRRDGFDETTEAENSPIQLGVRALTENTIDACIYSDNSRLRVGYVHH